MWCANIRISWTRHYLDFTLPAPKVCIMSNWAHVWIEQVLVQRIHSERVGVSMILHAVWLLWWYWYVWYWYQRKKQSSLRLSPPPPPPAHSTHAAATPLLQQNIFSSFHEWEGESGLDVVKSSHEKTALVINYQNSFWLIVCWSTHQLPVDQTTYS